MNLSGFILSIMAALALNQTFHPQAGSLTNVSLYHWIGLSRSLEPAPGDERITAQAQVSVLDILAIWNIKTCITGCVTGSWF